MYWHLTQLASLNWSLCTCLIYTFSMLSSVSEITVTVLCSFHKRCHLMLSMACYLCVFTFCTYGHLSYIYILSGTLICWIWLWHLTVITKYATTWTPYGQLALHGPILLILTIWLANVGSMLLIYLLILLAKIGPQTYHYGIFFDIPCDCIIATTDHSTPTMPFVVTAFQSYELPSLANSMMSKYQVSIQHPWADCMCVTSLKVIMLCQ